MSISDYDLLNELKKFHPVATTPMLAKNLNENPEEISNQLTKLKRG